MFTFVKQRSLPFWHCYKYLRKAKWELVLLNYSRSSFLLESEDIKNRRLKLYHMRGMLQKSGWENVGWCWRSLLYGWLYGLQKFGKMMIICIFSSTLFSWASMLSQMYADSVVLIGAEIFGTTWDTDVPLKMGIVDHHMENEITRYLNDRYYCAPWGSTSPCFSTCVRLAVDKWYMWCPTSSFRIPFQYSKSPVHAKRCFNFQRGKVSISIGSPGNRFEPWFPRCARFCGKCEWSFCVSVFGIR